MGSGFQYRLEFCHFFISFSKEKNMDSGSGFDILLK